MGGFEWYDPMTNAAKWLCQSIDDFKHSDKVGKVVETLKQCAPITGCFDDLDKHICRGVQKAEPVLTVKAFSFTKEVSFTKEAETKEVESIYARTPTAMLRGRTGGRE